MSSAPEGGTGAASVPPGCTTIPAVLSHAARVHADRPAVVDGPTRLSFRQLQEAVLLVGGMLVREGVEEGGRVGLWANNSVDWIVASFAILHAGATVVPLSTRDTVRELVPLVEDARLSHLLTVEEFLGRGYADEARSVGTLPVLTIGDDEAATLQWRDRAVPEAARPTLRARAAALTPTSTSHIQFTSGTSGRPKGAMLSHGAMVASTQRWIDVVGLDVSDRCPVIAPLYHVAGHKTGGLAPLMAGASSFPLSTADTGHVADAIERHQLTMVQTVPTVLQELVACARHDPQAFASLRTVVTGAAPVPPQLIRDIRAVLGVHKVFTAYGLSEATGVVTMTRSGDSIEVIASTSGRPIEGVEARVLAADGRALPRGEAGELCIRGDIVTEGYVGQTVGPTTDGWLHTGDIGVIDEAGNVTIVGRLKDMVLVGGLNVYPAEVEHCLREHPAVKDVAVVGRSHPRLGEVPVAFIVVRGAERIDVAGLTTWCAGRLARYKTPHAFHVVEELPRTGTGKLRKHLLRDGDDGVPAVADPIEH